MKKNYTAKEYMDMAIEAFNNKDAENCFKYCLKAAEMGHAPAMCSIGNFYWQGVGTKKNSKKVTSRRSNKVSFMVIIII